MKTLILDCCSSAGINCGEEDSEQYLIWWILNPPQIKNNTNVEIWSHSTRGGKLSESFHGMLNASHVLLATCGCDQYACKYLDIMHGIFTYNLMKVLNENDINTLTYTSLIDKIKMLEESYIFIVSLYLLQEHNLDFRQTAHCEGQIHRVLFNNVLGANNFFILARGEISSRMVSRIILEARAA